MPLPAAIATPAGFAVGILGKKGELKPYGWQADTINPFQQMSKGRVKVTCLSPNGGGRSSYCVADLALWVITAFPLGRVVITTVDGKQLDNQIWPAIAAHKAKFPNWTWRDREVVTDTGAQLIAFCTDEAARVEGWHRLPGATDVSGPLLMIVDEAKNFKEDMFVAVDRCSYDGLLLCSSSGLMKGRFFRTHHDLEGWHRVKVGLKDCPHIKEDKINDVVKQYGKDSPVTKSILDGEFMNFDGISKFVFQMEQLASSLKSTPQEVGTETVAFCDFAAGGDENVLAVRRGNRVSIVDAWREEDTMRATYRFINLFRKQGLRASQIYGDDGGLGHSMIDAMDEQGWKINRVDNYSPSIVEGYDSRGAEVWHEAAGMLRRGEIILPLQDSVLYGQLATREVAWGPRGLSVKSKKKMREDGEPSPDRGDAVCGAAVFTDVMGKMTETQRVNQRISNYAESQKEENESSYAHLAGML